MAGCHCTVAYSSRLSVHTLARYPCPSPIIQVPRDPVILSSSLSPFFDHPSQSTEEHIIIFFCCRIIVDYKNTEVCKPRMPRATRANICTS